MADTESKAIIDQAALSDGEDDNIWTNNGKSIDVGSTVDEKTSKRYTKKQSAKIAQCCIV